MSLYGNKRILFDFIIIILDIIIWK